MAKGKARVVELPPQLVDGATFRWTGLPVHRGTIVKAGAKDCLVTVDGNSSVMTWWSSDIARWSRTGLIAWD